MRVNNTLIVVAYTHVRHTGSDTEVRLHDAQMTHNIAHKNDKKMH